MRTNAHSIVLSLSIGITLAITAVMPLARGDSTQDLLGRMDKAAMAFKAMTANVEWTNHIEALNDDSKESGKVTIRKNGPGDIQGLVEFVKPDPKFVNLEKQSLQIYYPKTKMRDVYELGDQADQVYQFLMIGFGTSGTSLAKDYTMKVAGKDVVKGQAITAIRLELVPKSQRVRDNYVKKLELWIPEQGDPYPIQEKFSQPSGDYKLAVYGDLKINPTLKADAVQLKVPPGVTTERHSGK